MSLISAAEDRLLDRYLNFQDCCGADECEEECVCDQHHDRDSDEDARDYEWEAEDRAERMAERW